MSEASKAKFTKGPWIGFNNGKWADCGAWSVGNDEASSYSDVAVNAGDMTICLVVSDSWNDEEMESNAHLIAAAPDMYDVLSTIENDDGTIPEWLWDKIQITLAKARGE